MSESDDTLVDLGLLASLDEMFGSAGDTRQTLADFLVSAERWTRDIAGETRPGGKTDGHRAAHTLASSAAMVGAHALARAARSIERALFQGIVPDEATRRAPIALLDETRVAWIAAGRAEAASPTDAR